MKRNIYSLSIILILALSACNSSNGPQSDGEVNDGLRKSYRRDGSILSEANYKEGKLHGVAKNYYDNGNVHNLITYKKGVKDGLVQTYYKDGVLNRETTYKDGKIDGYQKKFFKDGKLSSEQNFKEDLPGALKEYSSNGKPVKSYPELIITPVNNIASTGEYILKITFSRNPRRGVYYDGELIDGEYFDENKVLRLAQKGGVGEIRIKVEEGEYINENFSIIGVLKTPRRNQYIVRKSYTAKVRG